jgi:hypothetical protein
LPLKTTVEERQLPNGGHLPEDCTFISKTETIVDGVKEVRKQQGDLGSLL